MGSRNPWHSPWFVFQVLLFPPCEAQSFATAAVVSGLPFRKAKADVEILSRRVGKCSPAIAINTVPFPLLLKGTPNRKVSAVCTASWLHFNCLAPTSLSCINKAASAFFAKCSLSLEIIASRGLPLRVFTTTFFPTPPRGDVSSAWFRDYWCQLQYLEIRLTVIKVNKNALKDSINRLVWLTSKWSQRVKGFACYPFWSVVRSVPQQSALPQPTYLILMRYCTCSTREEWSFLLLCGNRYQPALVLACRIVICLFWPL